MTAMMEATPATMPSSVSDERSLLLTIAPVDMLKRSVTRIASLFVAQRVDRIHARAFECGDEARDRTHRHCYHHRGEQDSRRHTGRHHGGVERRREQRGNDDSDEAAG